MKADLAFCALDAIEELVLILSEEDYSIVYANRAFSNETCSDFTKAKEYFEDWELFAEKLKEYDKDASGELQFRAELKHPLLANSKWIVRFSSLPHYKSICCVWKRSNPHEELLKYWDTFEKTTQVVSTWVEYHEEVDDIYFLYASQKVCDDFGKRRDQVIGKYATEVGLSKEETAEKKDVMKAAMQQKKVEKLMKVALPTGNIKQGFFSCNFLGYSDDEKKHPQFLVMFQDATEVEAMKDELGMQKKEIEVLKQFFESAPVNLGLLNFVENDTVVKYVKVNPYYASLLGKKVSEINGKTSRELGFPEDQVKNWIHEVKSRLHLEQKEFQFESINGFFSCIGVQISDNLYCFLSTNITELKKVSQELRQHQEKLEDLVKARTAQLEEALQVKGRFLATMSHEIRTPLTGISGALNLLSTSKLTQEQRDLVRIIDVCGQQLLVVINDVLDLSKMEENKLQLEMLPVDVLKKVEDSLDLVSFDAEKKNLELILDVENEIPESIIGDPIRIRQILVNLLTNAVKFTEKGEIVVKVAAKLIENNIYEFTFSVTDTGIGIKEEAKNRIFQPFSQADNSVTRKYGGSGLGLVICKRLVEQMGGNIDFKSIENSGTTFFFTIKTVASSGLSTTPKHTEKKSILVVLENDTLRRIATAKCINVGWEVDSFK